MKSENIKIKYNSKILRNIIIAYTSSAYTFENIVF